jgi:hypothetical protein
MHRGYTMTKIEYVQFLALLIPTFLILAAAAVSMADLAFPAEAARPQAVTVVVSGCEDRPAE